MKQASTSSKKIHLPALFGERGRERVAYEVDAVHDAEGIVVEVEAGRGARGNAVYRDLIRASLLVDVRYFVLGVMTAYRHKSIGKSVTVASYTDAKAHWTRSMQAVASSFPFKGCSYSVTEGPSLLGTMKLRVRSEDTG